MIKLSVAEYAKLNNISVQAVYKRLHKLETVEEYIGNRKQTLIIIEDKKENKEDIKPLLNPNSTEGLTELNPTLNPENPDIKPKTQKDIKPDSTEVLNHLNPILNLDSTLETLQEQLKIKDKQIESLQRIIDEQSKQLAEYSLKVLELAEKAQQIASQSQFLQLTDKRTEKQSIFKRLFGKKEE